MPQAEGEPKGLTKWREELGKLPRHGAISHLFLAIDAEGLDLSHIDDPAHLVVQVSRCNIAGMNFCIAYAYDMCNLKANAEFILFAQIRIGTALSKTPKISAPSSSPPSLTKRYARRVSTSFTYILLEANPTNRGRN